MTPSGSALLITGASGFLGRHLLERLPDKWEIYAVSRGSPRHSEVPPDRRVEWLFADISDRLQMARLRAELLARKPIAAVIHLAAYYDFTGRMAPEYRLTNVFGLRNVLELASELQPEQFVFASSIAACDFTDDGQCITERTPPLGKSPYAWSKKLGEKMVIDYGSRFPTCIVRLPALFSDWGEYEPLNHFLDGWLNPGWRRRILGGRGRSAIPYMHVHDAVCFIWRALRQRRELETGEVLIASPDGSVSHRELHAVATACHYGRRIRPIPLPRQLCRMGIRLRYALGLATHHPPFEKPWMVSCIDRRLDVDSSRSRARLDWAPRTRLSILRRMPFLIQNRKSHPSEWLRRNHLGAHRYLFRSCGRVYNLLSIHESRILESFAEQLQDPAQRIRLPAYFDCSENELAERNRMLLEQLMCSVRTGDKSVFRYSAESMAERWFEEGRPLGQLAEALNVLGTACARVLREDPRAENLDLSLYDHITMAFQFAVDAVAEVSEMRSAQDPHLAAYQMAI